ncbi:MAG: ATP-binding cassette domain-containing protein [Deltaproteobacteria bacterium]|nr:ATP-binding cassette domain-containing protein [Deltaproteobacteria bacterium]
MSAPRPPVVLEARGLSIESLSRAQGAGELHATALYSDADLTALRGEVVLLLGASGSGKSLLMQLLLGRVSASTESVRARAERLSLSLDDAAPVPLLDARARRALDGELGVVFQGLGLLEDLSAQQNLDFANDHSAHALPPREWLARRAELARDLGLEGVLQSPVSALSGGQRQRVAVARLIAYQPRVMLFDEPTSALDTHLSATVVRLIREAHARAQSQLTLIITHDYASFAPIADRVWLISSERRIEEDAPPAPPARYLEALRRAPLSARRALPRAEALVHVARARDAALHDAPARLAHDARRALAPLAAPRRLRWLALYGWRLFGHVVLHGLPFHLLAAFVVGVIATYFTFNTDMGSVWVAGAPGGAGGDEVRVSRFLLPTFFKEMLSGFSVALYRALIPAFTCVCVAARGGTAAAAYLSGMRDPVRGEWEALAAFGVSPRAFFGVLLAVTFSVGCALLSALSFLTASLGALLTSLWTNELCDLSAWWGAFVGGLEVEGGAPRGTGMALLKTSLSGLAIAAITLHFGARPRERAEDVMRHLGAANVWSVLMTLLIFFALLVLEAR